MKIQRPIQQTEEIEIILPYYYKVPGYTYDTFCRVAGDHPKVTSVTLMRDGDFATVIINSEHVDIPQVHTIISPEEFTEALDMGLKLQQDVIMAIINEAAVPVNTEGGQDE